MMERVGDRWEKMEGSRSTGQSPQRAVVPMEEEEDRDRAREREKDLPLPKHIKLTKLHLLGEQRCKVR
jgi:hypothetical protein